MFLIIAGSVQVDVSVLEKALLYANKRTCTEVIGFCLESEFGGVDHKTFIPMAWFGMRSAINGIFRVNACVNTGQGSADLAKP